MTILPDPADVERIRNFLKTGKIPSDQETVDAAMWGKDTVEARAITCKEFNVACAYLTPEVIEHCLSFTSRPDHPPPPKEYEVFVRWGNNQKTPIKEYLASEQYEKDWREGNIGRHKVPLVDMRFLGDMPGQPGLWYRPLTEHWDMIATHRTFTSEELEDPVTAELMAKEFEANDGGLILCIEDEKTYKERGMTIPEDIARDFGVKETDKCRFTEHVGYTFDAKTRKIIRDTDAGPGFVKVPGTTAPIKRKELSREEVKYLDKRGVKRSQSHR